MKPTFRTSFLAVILTMICCHIHAQSVQYGYVEEYQIAKEKTPLAGVVLNAGSGRDC